MIREEKETCGYSSKNTSVVCGPSFSTWVTTALELPLRFAQVREDSLIDLALVRMCNAQSVLAVCGGGCTIAALAGLSRIKRVAAVDINPAQLSITKLKLSLLAKPLDARLALLGHMHCTQEARQILIKNICEDAKIEPGTLGPIETVARLGVDYAGRYEAIFEELRSRLAPFEQHILQLCMFSSVPEQRTFYRLHPHLRKAIANAFDEVMELKILEVLFGTAATAARKQSFAAHFFERIANVVELLPNSSNPFLWQLLIGKFPPNMQYLWLSSPIRSHSTYVDFFECDITKKLESASIGEYDFINLSNTLDWLHIEEAKHVLTLARRALSPSGLLVLRQLNSTNDPRLFDVGIKWFPELSESAHLKDRSFFYSDLHIGRRNS